MTDKKEELKTIELWEGMKVTLTNPELLSDFDFLVDFQEARNKQDIRTFVSMCFALIGGEETYDAVRKHIIGEKGYFDSNELLAIVEKIVELFPKAQSPAQRRW